MKGQKALLVSLCTMSIALTVGLNASFANNAPNQGNQHIGSSIPDSLIVPDELIVEVKQGTKYADSTALFSSVNAKSYEPISTEAWLVKFNPGDLQVAQAKLKTNQLVWSIGRNFRLTQCSSVAPQPATQPIGSQLFKNPAAPNDPYFYQQWYMSAVGAGTGKPVADSWNGTALLDAGISSSYYNHDLNYMMGNVPINGGEQWGSGSGVASEQHGTMLATTLGAKWNDIGTAGVQSNPRLWSVKLTNWDHTEITEADVIKGLLWARGNIGNTAGYPWAAAVPLNVTPPYSLSNMTYHPAFHHICQNIHDKMSGMIFLAAGNDGKFDDSPRKDYLDVVAACDQSGKLAPTSNFGNNVTFVAPGTNIVCSDQKGQIVTGQGTSFSAVIAAGVAGLIHNIGRDHKLFLYNTGLETIMRNSAINPAGQWTSTYGFGMPNVKKAIEAALK